MKASNSVQVRKFVNSCTCTDVYNYKQRGAKMFLVKL